jgi:predicted type IV restriction endonuclease
MKELSASRKKQFLSALKTYRKKYLVGKYSELDESATRIMINSFLTDVLGYASLDEVKTEYMIRGTYADYIVQIKGKRHFIVEVKSMGLELSPKHLRQTVNYAANEGIEWALLTNGRRFQFYKILFQKPIDSRRVFSVDLSEDDTLEQAADNLQYLGKHLLPHKGLDNLWHKYSALEPMNISRLLFSKPIINYIRRELRRTSKSQFESEEIRGVIVEVIKEQFATPTPRRARKSRKRKVAKLESDMNREPIESPLADTNH